MKKILITGSAGFIGTNSAVKFANNGWQVIAVDNLSRPGAQDNLDWLQTQAKVSFVKADIRDEQKINDIVKAEQPDVLLHLAAQVAVTTSVINPREDFEINALGTFNLLEAVRNHQPDCFFINASTNKVYGKMEDCTVVEQDQHYAYETINGVSENRELDFHSPYGCSKGAADQYCIDYARIYNLNTVNLRQSCIYGQRQLGVEDQGWVAWFTIASLFGKPITIYGNGKQVRDILHINDLIRCYELCIEKSDQISGQAINVGGGPDNTLSLLELLDMLKQKTGIDPNLSWADWRPGDQPVFICQLDKAKQQLDWQPEINVDQGVSMLIDWVKQHRQLFNWL